MKRIFFLGLVSIFLGGCVTTWTPVGEENVNYKSNSFSVSLPAGWMQWEAGRNKYTIRVNGVTKKIDAERVQVTNDGPQLQYIDVIFLTKENAFPSIQKALTAGMLPSEIADYEIADTKARTGIEHLKVLKNIPASINGSDGFLLHLRYKNSGGLRIDEVIYGFGSDNGLYTLTYRAPVLHYFDKDYATFDSVVKSFRHS